MSLYSMRSGLYAKAKAEAKILVLRPGDAKSLASMLDEATILVSRPKSEGRGRDHGQCYEAEAKMLASWPNESINHVTAS